MQFLNEIIKIILSYFAGKQQEKNEQLKRDNTILKEYEKIEQEENDKIKEKLRKEGL